MHGNLLTYYDADSVYDYDVMFQVFYVGICKHYNFSKVLRSSGNYSTCTFYKLQASYKFSLSFNLTFR